jgi:hypothetical protein
VGPRWEQLAAIVNAGGVWRSSWLLRAVRVDRMIGLREVDAKRRRPVGQCVRPVSDGRQDGPSETVRRRRARAVDTLASTRTRRPVR